MSDIIQRGLQRPNMSAQIARIKLLFCILFCFPTPLRECIDPTAAYHCECVRVCCSANLPARSHYERYQQLRSVTVIVPLCFCLLYISISSSDSPAAQLYSGMCLPQWETVSVSSSLCYRRFHLSLLHLFFHFRSLSPEVFLSFTYIFYPFFSPFHCLRCPLFLPFHLSTVIDSCCQ